MALYRRHTDAQELRNLTELPIKSVDKYDRDALVLRQRL
jgi:hypothetical protein